MLSAQSKSSIKLEWAAVKDAETYSIYRSDSLNGKYSRIGMVLNPAFTDTALTASTGYYYKISAENECGEGAMSNPKSETTQACPTPAAPQNVSAEAQSSTKISISWDEVNTAVSYKVYRSATSTGTYSPVGSTSGKSSTTWEDEGLNPATTYYYKVTAESECMESAQSNYGFTTTICENAPETAPTNITAEALSSMEIKLSWDEVSGLGNLDYYNIYISETPNSGYYQSTRIRASYTEYTLTSREPSTTYYIKISAENSCGESVQSIYATATTEDCDLPIPLAPTGINAVASSSRSVVITWDKADGAVSYDVYRGTERSGTYTTVRGGRGLTGNSFTDTTLSASTTYYYSVKSINSCGGTAENLGGNIVEATTLCETPIPTNVSAAAKSSSSIEITWDVVPNAVSYSVYRSSTATGAYTLIEESKTASNSFTNTGLSSLTTYHYRVKAKTALCDESQMSVSVPGTTQ